MVLLDGSAAHLIAGGFAGTVGAIVTSPLEVVKTRLQSSVNSWNAAAGAAGLGPRYPMPLSPLVRVLAGGAPAVIGPSSQQQGHQGPHLSIYQCLRHIQRTEGFRALFKGLSMTILGVLPSRAIYFSAYFNGQEMFSSLCPKGSHTNVVLAAGFSSFVSSTVTNPIWFVKTRLQLDQSPSAHPLSVWRCTRDVWAKGGPRGFYKGIQASYLGIAETSLHFVLYEHLKRSLIRWSRGSDVDLSNGLGDSIVSRADDMVFCSIASMCSKSTVTVFCYPHEVLRTRLRQEGSKYTGLVQTLRLIVKEEGFRALYKGLMTHFVRQIPNTCIVLTTYEGVLHFFRTNGMLL